MTDPVLPPNPPSYPQGGTFGALLEWHLSWGTRPGCSASKKGTRWILSSFAQLIHDPGEPPENGERNLRNWRQDKHPPRDGPVTERLFDELFGDQPDLRRWKEDLAAALSMSRKKHRDPPAKRKSLATSIVPRPTPHFVGRDDEVNALARALVSANQPSAILVQGGPGVGKTELTKAIAHHDDVIKRFDERRWYVQLETATTAEAMKDAIIQALGCDPQHGFEAALKTLRDKQTLLILDNLETPWEPPEQREPIHQTLANLDAVPGLSILASFRGVEAVDGPKWNPPHTVSALFDPDATKLFESLAGQWVLADPYLDDFIRVLGGVPLAIQLIARQAYGRSSLKRLWQEWNIIGTDLARHPDFKEGRLTSVPHSIELSLQSRRIAASDAAQRLFSFLGFFPAGLATEDIDALLGNGAVEAEQRLIRGGLAVDRDGRIDLLPPVREYALRHQNLEEKEIDRCADHFLNLVNLLGEIPGVFIAEGTASRVLAEYRNIEAALRAKMCRDRRADVMASLKSFGTATILSGMSSVFFEELALACHKEGDTVGKILCLIARANIAVRRSDVSVARPAYELALSLCRQTGKAEGEANALLGLANISFLDSDHDAAQAAYEEARQLFRMIDDVLGEANCIMALGSIALGRSDYDAAEAAYEEALPVYRQLGNWLGEANCMMCLGHIAFSRSDGSSAQAAYEQALTLYRQIGDALGEADCYCCLGNVAGLRSDNLAARAAYERALALYRKIGNEDREANCVRVLQEIELALDQHA